MRYFLEKITNWLKARTKKQIAVTAGLGSVAGIAAYNFLLGGVLSVSVLATTPTQAVLSYTAPSASACTIEISESATYAPVVNDASSTLFSLSNSDTSRGGTLASSTTRTIVIGERTAEQASDGKFYSRALQADTLHYFRITCGGDTGTGTFTTKTPQWSLAPEAYPFNSAAPGNYAWPTIDWTDDDKVYIDPQTGVLVKRMTGPGGADFATTTATSTLLAYDPSGNWNATSSGYLVDGSFATTTSEDPLFVRFDQVCVTTCADTADYNEADYSIDDFEAAIRAYNETSQSAQICLSVNGVSCATAWKDITVGSSVATTTFPTGFPNSGLMTQWMGTGDIDPIGRTKMAKMSGTVNTSGTTVTYASGNLFPDHWTAGSRITIAGAEYTIATYTNATSLVLASSAGTQSGAAYSAVNFGLLIRKSSGAGGTLLVDGVKTRYSRSLEFMSASHGNLFNCNRNTLTVESREAYMCSLQNTLWLMFTDTGETRSLGNLSLPFNYDGAPGQDATYTTTCNTHFHDKNDPETFYCFAEDAGITPDPGSSLIKLTYDGDYTAIGGTTRASTTKTRLTRPSEGSGLHQLLEAKNSEFDIDRYGNCYPSGENGQYIVGGCWNSQDRYAFLWSFDTFSTTSTSTMLTSAFPNFTASTTRWAVSHSVFSSGDDTHSFYVAKDSTSNHNTLTVNEVATTSTTTMSSSYIETCPTDIPQLYKDFGATGSNCATLEFTGEACFTPVTSWESTNLDVCSYDGSKRKLMDVAVGDVGQGTVSSQTENFLFVKETATNTWVVMREYEPYYAGTLDNKSPYNKQNFSGSWTLTMVCNFCAGSALIPWRMSDGYMGYAWNFAPAGHSDVTHIGGTMTGYDGNLNQYVTYIWADDATASIGATNTYATFATSGWSSLPINNATNIAYFQSHQSWRQINATTTELDWYLDGHPFAPSAGGNFNLWSQSGVTAVTGDLYKIASSSLHTPNNRKLIPPVLFAGGYTLQDVSSTSTILTGAASDNWKYCWAYEAGECYSGSSAGDLYFSIPNAYSDGTCGNSYYYRRPCVTFMHSARLGVFQHYASADYGKQRMMTSMFNRYNWTWTYQNAVSIPNGEWAITGGSWLSGARNDMLLVKIPQSPTSTQAIWKDFATSTIAVTAPSGLDAQTAQIKFGYAEQGDIAGHYCTTRREACVAATSTASAFKTYYYADSDTYSRVSCSTSCNIYLPAIPDRIIYYTIEFYDSGGAVVATQDGITIETLDYAGGGVEEAAGEPAAEPRAKIQKPIIIQGPIKFQ